MHFCVVSSWDLDGQTFSLAPGNSSDLSHPGQWNWFWLACDLSYPLRVFPGNCEVPHRQYNHRWTCQLPKVLLLHLFTGARDPPPPLTVFHPEVPPGLFLIPPIYSHCFSPTGLCRSPSSLLGPLLASLTLTCLPNWSFKHVNWLM